MDEQEHVKFVNEGKEKKLQPAFGGDGSLGGIIWIIPKELEDEAQIDSLHYFDKMCKERVEGG